MPALPGRIHHRIVTQVLIDPAPALGKRCHGILGCSLLRNDKEYMAGIAPCLPRMPEGVPWNDRDAVKTLKNKGIVTGACATAQPTILLQHLSPAGGRGKGRDCGEAVSG